MGIIHTPRVIWSLLNGLRKHRAIGNSINGTISASGIASSPGTTPEKVSGLGLHVNDPHIYHAHVGIFDVDYQGHKTNSSYFAHSEYARWEMTAYNGLLQSMYETNTHYMVASTYCRYRAEIRPIFRKFQIETYVAGLDDKHLWMYVFYFYVVVVLVVVLYFFIFFFFL